MILRVAGGHEPPLPPLSPAVAGGATLLSRQMRVTFALIRRYNARMPGAKVSTLNLRISPALKNAVRQAAAREHRSIANMVEVLIRRHCDEAGITVADAPRHGRQHGDG